MEVLNVVSAIASITQLLQVARTLAGTLQDISTSSSALLPEIGNQLPLLALVLQRIRDDLEPGRAAPEDQVALQDTLNGCQLQLNDLSQLLKDLQQPHPHVFERARRLFRRPRQEKRALSISKSIEKYKSTLGLYLGQNIWSTIESPQRHQEDIKMYSVPTNKVSRFIGREGALEALDRAYFSGNSLITGPQIVAITGMGGIGKTQLVLEHCQRMKQLRKIQTIVWTDASSPASLSNSFENVLPNLPGHPPVPSDPAARIVHVKYRVFESSDSWLMVLDNFDQPSLFSSIPIQHYFPSGPNGCIIILSRNAEIQRLGLPVELGMMSESDGIELLLYRTSSRRSPESETEAVKIVTRLGNLPLAIDQAGAYIVARGLELGDFVSEYETRREDILRDVPALWEYRRTGADGEEDYLLSVSTTWEMSLQQLEEDSAANVEHFFSVVAFFQSRSIPKSLFKLYFESTDSLPDWVNFSTNGQWDHFKFENMLARLKALSLLEELKTDVDSGSHLHIAAERFASFYKRHGRYKEAKDLRQRLLDYLVAELGENHHSTFDATRKLGQIYYKEANYPKAKELYLKALAGQEHLLGIEDPSTLQSLVDLASVHLKQGDYRSAEPLLHRVKAAQEKDLGKSHPKTLWTAMNIGLVYKKLGRFKEAERLYVTVLHDQVQQLSRDHADTLKTLMNLASVKTAQGQYDEAEILSRQVVEIRERILGPNHPNTLRALWNLGRVYLDLHRFFLADELFKRALKGQELQLGPDHPITLKTLGYYAQLALVQNDHESAATLFQKEFRGLEEKCGPSHPNTLWCAHGLANAYRNQGFHAEARALYQSVKNEYDLIWEASHPEVKRLAEDILLNSKEQVKG